MISWETLSEYLEKGIPAQIPVVKDSPICFLTGAGGISLALRLPAESTDLIPVSPYAELCIRQMTLSDKSIIELHVTQPSLFHTFYLFSDLVVRKISLEGARTESAIRGALETWAKLLLRRQMLGPSEQIGLTGELWFLEALLVSLGTGALDSWVGPLRQPHDFRIDGSEFEIKTTMQARRIHRIHGLGQLEPSVGMELYILSLQFQPAGGASRGKSLSERVGEIRSMLAKDWERHDMFEEYIGKLGYRDADADFYLMKVKLRSLPRLIPVDQNFPKLTQPIIEGALPKGTVQRIPYIEYDLDVDGLGYPEGHSAYWSLLPWLNGLEPSDE